MINPYKRFKKMEQHIMIKHMPSAMTDHCADGKKQAIFILKNSKGFPTEDPIDFVCFECGKWAGDLK